MKELAYLGRLGFHGGKLLARVLFILASVAIFALRYLSKNAGVTAPADSNEAFGSYRVRNDDFSYLRDGITPTIENTDDPQWAAYYGEPK